MSDVTVEGSVFSIGKRRGYEGLNLQIHDDDEE
jgi:hypothetical protein